MKKYIYLFYINSTDFFAKDEIIKANNWDEANAEFKKRQPNIEHSAAYLMGIRALFHSADHTSSPSQHEIKL